MADTTGLGTLQSLALGLVVTAILVIVSLNILDTLWTNQYNAYLDSNAENAGCNTTSGVYTNCGAGSNATLTTIQAVDDIPDWFAIIVIVVVGVVIFALLRMFGASV